MLSRSCRSTLDAADEPMRLTDDERAMLAGDAGPGVQLAMKLVAAVAESEDAPHLIDIEGAHIDGCLFHGQSGIDLAKALARGGAQVRVPTTLNVASIDMLHPEIYRGDPETARLSRELTDTYEALGCESTWTCAPYQLATRPRLGQQIAWGESNAIVFANSVLGARTNRYGDFIDICCALTGRAPYTGLHTDEGRLGSIEFVLDIDARLLDMDALYPVLGYLIGARAGTDVPVIVGLDDRASEDRLKALGAAAASSGAVAMFHVVGVTPEAPDRGSAFGGRSPSATIRVGIEELNGARTQLSTGSGPLGAVSVGTPHMSLTEMQALASLARDATTKVPFYVNTGRAVLEEAEKTGVAGRLEHFGATFVTDTCTYITPIIGDVSGVVMTDSAKWAHYAPANLGVEVVFGSLSECVMSAIDGRVVTSDAWR